MKKLMFFLATACMLSLTSNAQETKTEKKEARKEHRQMEASEATFKAKQAFLSDNGNVPISKSGAIDGISFFTYKKEGKPLTAYYDENAQLAGTIQKKTYADIPLKAKKEIAKWYKGYAPTSVLFLDDNETNINNLILYGMDSGNEDSYFVEMSDPITNKKIVVKVNMNGEVSYFIRLI